MIKKLLLINIFVMSLYSMEEERHSQAKRYLIDMFTPFNQKKVNLTILLRRMRENALPIEQACEDLRSFDQDAESLLMRTCKVCTQVIEEGVHPFLFNEVCIFLAHLGVKGEEGTRSFALSMIDKVRDPLPDQCGRVEIIRAFCADDPQVKYDFARLVMEREGMLPRELAASRSLQCQALRDLERYEECALVANDIPLDCLTRGEVELLQELKNELKVKLQK